MQIPTNAESRTALSHTMKHCSVSDEETSGFSPARVLMAGHKSRGRPTSGAEIWDRGALTRGRIAFMRGAIRQELQSRRETSFNEIRFRTRRAGSLKSRHPGAIGGSRFLGLLFQT